MAPIPLRHYLATALLGDQQGVTSVMLSELFSSGGSNNLFIDKFGNIKQILGYLQQNATPIVTNTGAAPTRLRSIFHYVNQTSGVITRQEIGIFDDAAAHWEFRTSVDVGVTWTFVNDYTTSFGYIPDFAQSGNLLTITNGKISPAQWDGTTLTVSGSTQIAAPTFTSTGAGTLVGNFGWRILPMVGSTRKLSSVQSINYTLIATTGAGHVDWTADADGTVTAYEVYRTTGSGSVFFFEGVVSGRTTVTFNVGAGTDTDALIQANRVLQEFGDPPPVGAYFCEMHGQRMFMGRTDTDPRLWYYSDPGLPYSFYKAFNKLDFSDAESMSDLSTGGTGDFLGMFVVWMERSVWTLSGTGTVIGTVTNWKRTRTNAQMGTVSHRTVARIPLGSAYLDAEGGPKKTKQVTLAYLTPLGDIRLFDGDDDEVISHPMKDTLATANYAARNRSYCVVDRQRSEVVWVFAAGSSTEPNQAVAWNYRWGTWYARDWPFACVTEIETPTSSSVLLAGEQSLAIGGLCYLLWSGFSFNGAAIASQWMTKTIYGVGSFNDPPGMYGKPMISHRKRWRWADFLFDVTGGQASITVEWLLGDDPLNTALGNDSHIVAVPSSTLETSDGSIIETLEGNPLVVQSTPVLLRAKLQDTAGKYATSRGLRLRLRLSTSSAQWSVSSIDVGYQVLSGEKRTIGAIP